MNDFMHPSIHQIYTNLVGTGTSVKSPYQNGEQSFFLVERSVNLKIKHLPSKQLRSIV